MNDEQLRDALRGLPRVGATEGFTQRVLRAERAADADATQRPRSSSPWLYAAAAVVLVTGLTLAALNRQPASHEEGLAAGSARDAPALTEIDPTKAATVEDLRQEYAALRRELQSLRRTATPPAPVVYLGGNDKVDLVLDVGRLGDLSPRELGPRNPNPRELDTGEPGIRPASLH